MKTTTTITSSQQQDVLMAFFFDLKKRFFDSTFFESMGGTFQKTTQNPFASRTGGMLQFKRNFKKNYIVFVPIGIALVVVLVMIGSFLSKKPTTSSVQGASDQRVKINAPLATDELNKSYVFSATDAAGKPVKVKFEIQSVELRDQIVLRAQPVVAVSGRVFAIANIKIVNDTTANVAMNTQDYLRLIVDDSPDMLAPEIHNDPVRIQAISTKLTRDGFAIDDSAKKLVLQVGEIDGKKELITLHLKP